MPAATHHGVNPWVLQAILKVESNFNPSAVNRNLNGTVDVGIAQINSIHFPRLAAQGITEAHLKDACVGTYVAAWHLAQQIRRYGNTWFGVAAYHSVSPCLNNRYSGLIWNALTDWAVVQGPKVRVPPLAACTGVQPALRTPPSRSPGSTSTVLAFDATP